MAVSGNKYVLLSSSFGDAVESTWQSITLNFGSSGDEVSDDDQIAIMRKMYIYSLGYAEADSNYSFEVNSTSDTIGMTFSEIYRKEQMLHILQAFYLGAHDKANIPDIMNAYLTARASLTADSVMLLDTISEDGDNLRLTFDLITGSPAPLEDEYEYIFKSYVSAYMSFMDYVPVPSAGFDSVVADDSVSQQSFVLPRIDWSDFTFTLGTSFIVDVSLNNLWIKALMLTLTESLVGAVGNSGIPSLTKLLSKTMETLY